jgi:hypothetical protein
MKSIELKLIEQTKEDGTKAIFKDYKEILLLAIKAVNPQSPPNLEEMAEKIGIINKIKAIPAGAVLHLENSECRTLAKSCEQPIWTILDEDLYTCLSYVKSVNEGPETEVKK